MTCGKNFVRFLSLGTLSAVAFAGITGWSGTLNADQAISDAPPLADDIIPQEEMDELGLDQERVFLRLVTPKEISSHAERRVQIIVYKTMRKTGRQHMEVYVDGNLQEIFTVSTAFEREVTGKSGRTYFARTPNGKFFPDSLERKRYSNLWKVWLEYVIPFSGGVWIHATTPDHYDELGAPASGGCVRLHLDDAERLFKIVQEYGLSQTAITVLPQENGEPQVRPRVAPGR